jgi:hypothetical protein
MAADHVESKHRERHFGSRSSKSSSEEPPCHHPFHRSERMLCRASPSAHQRGFVGNTSRHALQRVFMLMPAYPSNLSLSAAQLQFAP